MASAWRRTWSSRAGAAYRATYIESWAIGRSAPPPACGELAAMMVCAPCGPKPRANTAQGMRHVCCAAQLSVSSSVTLEGPGPVEMAEKGHDRRGGERIRGRGSRTSWRSKGGACMRGMEVESEGRCPSARVRQQ